MCKGRCGRRVYGRRICAAGGCALWGTAYHSIHRRLNYEPKLCDFLCMFVNTLEANDKNEPIRGNYMCLNIFLCRVDLSSLLFAFLCYFISTFWCIVPSSPCRRGCPAYHRVLRLVLLGRALAVCPCASSRRCGPFCLQLSEAPAACQRPPHCSLTLINPCHHLIVSC